MDGLTTGASAAIPARVLDRTKRALEPRVKMKASLKSTGHARIKLDNREG